MSWHCGWHVSQISWRVRCMEEVWKESRREKEGSTKEQD